MNPRRARNPFSRSSAPPCGKSGRLRARPDRLSSWEGASVGQRKGAGKLIELIRVKSCVSRAWPTSAPSVPDGIHELAEQGAGVVGARRRLGVVLHAKDGKLPVPQPLHGPV